jgi:hypothetical protein
MQREPQPSLQIKATTWYRDTHGLFDYESPQVTTKTLNIQHPGIIVRQNHEVFFYPDPIQAGDAELLFAVEPSHRGFLLKTCRDRGGEDLWESVRHRERELLDRDVVKIGRLQLQLAFNSQDDLSDSYHTEDSIEDSSEGVCRICLAGDEGETDNPLISPCNCAGSMKYIHYLCLFKWLQSKMVMRTFTDFQVFYWKALECELCKQPLPRTFNYEGTSLCLCKAPSEATVVIDCFNKENSLNRGLTILSMGDRALVKIGRGHESDLRIPDISVSRCHSSLEKDGARFVLRDLNSKFGTLVLVTYPQFVPLNSSRHFQVGRTYFVMDVRPSNYPVQPSTDVNSEDDISPEEDFESA